MLSLEAERFTPDVRKLCWSVSHVTSKRHIGLQEGDAPEITPLKVDILAKVTSDLTGLHTILMTALSLFNQAWLGLSRRDGLLFPSE